MTDHQLIKRFQLRAELLDLQCSKAGQEDALVLLAAWMDLAKEHLTEDDMAALCEVGGILYRDGLRRRMA